MNTEPSLDVRTLATYLRASLSSLPQVHKYWDDYAAQCVRVLSAVDVPVKGVTTFATLGLSDHSTNLSVEEKPLRVELVCALESAFADAGNIAASCVFDVISRDIAPSPGVVLPNVVKTYKPNGPLKHCLLVSPFLWELETQEFSEKTVAWLQIVPISDGELNVALSQGADELERLFECEQIDVFNLDRPAIV